MTCLGVTCIGRVDSVGPGAVSLQPGQLVFFDITVRARDNPTVIMLQGLIAIEQDGGQKLQSYWRNGSFAEKVLVPLENVHPLPESLLTRYSPAQLLELNTALVPYGGFLAGKLEPGQRVLIHPATGHFGSSGVAIAVAMGASAVLVAGRNKEVLKELVKRFGPRVIPVAVEGKESDTEIYAKYGPVDMILNIHPPGVDPKQVVYPLPALKFGGSLVLMGGIFEEFPIPYGELMRKNIIVRGQWMYDRSAIAKAVGLIEAGLFDLSAFEHKSYKLDDIHEAIEFSASKENRGWLYSVVLEPNSK